MKKIKEVITFYSKPIIITQLINITLLCTLGTYFEEYEGLFSSFVKGVYTRPVIYGTDVNVHFLIMKIYFYLNQFFNTIQLYGYILICYNWICITLAGLIIYRIFSINLKQKSVLLFILIYLFVGADSLLNLSTTRIALIGAFALVGYIESVKSENNKFTKLNLLIIILIAFFLALLRAEVVFIAAIIHIIVLIVYKKFHLLTLPLLFFGFLVFFSYYIIMTTVEKEPKMVYYTHEKDLVDRSNLHYDDLSIHSLDLKAFLEYGISDKEIFTEAFYKSAELKGGILSILNGFSIIAFTNTIDKSISSFLNSKFYIILYIYMCLFLLYFSNSNKFKIFTMLIAGLLFPFLVCLNTIAPLRFIVPYFTAITVLNIFILLHYKPQKKSWIITILIITNYFIIYNNSSLSIKYKQIDNKFEKNMLQLKTISNTEENKNPIIINNFNLEKFFPINPLRKIDKQNVLILNLYLLNSYEFYIQKWNEICHCNSLSFKDKIIYIATNQNLFICDQRSVDFTKYYVKTKYNMNITFNKLNTFDNDLYIYTLSFY